MNFIDRFIGYIDPRAGMQRAQARRVLATLQHYDAAAPSRHRKFYRDGAAPNQITQQSALALRAQARQLERNHDISRGMLRTMTNNVVGPNGIGIEPQPRKKDGTIHEEYAKALRDIYREWALAPEVTGSMSWGKVQRMMYKSKARDGEVFAQELLGPVPGLQHGSRLPFSLELFESDLVPYYYQDPATNTYQGIRRNAWGRALSYKVLKTHPGESSMTSLLSSEMKDISADRMHHLKLVDRIGQLRGVTDFASIITRLEDIKDYEESERIAAKIAASLTAYVKKGEAADYAGPSVDAQGNPIARQIGMSPGMIIDGLAPGEEVGMIDSNRPNPNLITFRQGQLRAVASGIGISYSSAAKDYNGTFSAQRQELVEQYVNYATLTDDFVGEFVQPVWSTIVIAADLSGLARIPADVVRGTENDALFIGQSMPWIDPLKEANAWVTLVKAGFASEVEVIRKRGGNPRDVLEQVATWRKQSEEKGLKFDSDAALQHAMNSAMQDNAGNPPNNT